MEKSLVKGMPTEVAQKPIIIHETSVIETEALPTITEIQETISIKIREDVIRFRTCCADPRASK